jgi:hypothetical protein
MADEQTPQVGTNGTTPAVVPVAQVSTPFAPVADDVESLPEYARKMIADLRKENASHRQAKTAAEKAAQAATEQAAKEQGKWQELATTYEPKAKRAEALESFIAETLAAELANVPERLKALVPEGDALGQLRWLRTAKTAGLFTPPTAPTTDAGEASRNVPRGLLSKERRADLAARYGVREDLLPDTLGV